MIRTSRRHVILVKIAPDGTKLVQRGFDSDGERYWFGVAVAAVNPGLRDRRAGAAFRRRMESCTIRVTVPCSCFTQDEAGNDLMGMIFGGDGADDGGTAIVTNGSNAAFVTGFTNNSINFPRTTFAFRCCGFEFS